MVYAAMYKIRLTRRSTTLPARFPAANSIRNSQKMRSTASLMNYSAVWNLRQRAAWAASVAPFSEITPEAPEIRVARSSISHTDQIGNRKPPARGWLYNIQGPVELSPCGWLPVIPPSQATALACHWRRPDIPRQVNRQAPLSTYRAWNKCSAVPPATPARLANWHHPHLKQ